MDSILKYRYEGVNGKIGGRIEVVACFVLDFRNEDADL